MTVDTVRKAIQKACSESRSKTQYTLRLKAETAEWLKAKADANGVSANELAAQLLETLREEEGRE